MNFRTYGAYGYRVATTVDMARTGYAGEAIEITHGWYLLGRRFFIPWLRRFISPDPVSPFGAGGLNRFGYCAGDPINRIDPSGHASFGWLGRLLGQLIGGVAGSTAHAMASITPSTVLATISRTAEVVSVSVGIGAVATTALGDTQTASILGWIASGSAATASMGVATQAIGKSARNGRGTPLDKNGTSRPMSDMSSRPIREVAVKDAFFGSSRSSNTIQYRHEDSTGYTVYEMRTIQYLQPEWHMYRHPQNPESLHVVADSIVSSYDLGASLHAISREGLQVDTVSIYGNVHGYRHGLNRAPDGRWAVSAPGMFDTVARHSDVDLSDDQIRLFDLSSRSASDYRQNMRSNGAHIHYYCYSAASEDIVNELRIGQVYPSLAMAPPPVFSPVWYHWGP